MVDIIWSIWHDVYQMIWLNIPSKDYNLVNVKYYDVNKKLNQRLREARKLTDDWESKLICLDANEFILKKHLSIYCTY